MCGGVKMCGLYKQDSTTEWLKTQVAVIEAWAADLSDDPSANIRLLDCVTTHKDWLTREIEELSAPT